MIAEVEIQIVAIETNVKTLLKSHPNPQQFIKTLQNEAIDQAFRELSGKMAILENNVFKDIWKIYDQLETMNKHIEFLEKRTHHLAPKIGDV